MGEIFNKICEKLCKSITAISQYNLLKAELKEMTKKKPTLQPWIKWWDARCAHTFAPFKVAGLPGVNLSEMGNAGWKPCNTLRLVHAAKQDIASMMLQETEIFLFNRKMAKSTGRGLSKAVRNSREQQEQIKIAEDFSNILDDEEAIRLEAEQAENPSVFIPRGNSKHRLSQSAESYDVHAENKKVRKKTTTTRKKKKCNPEIGDACFTENLALATEIIAQTPTDEDTSQILVQPLVPSGFAQYVERNPPVVKTQLVEI